MVSAPPATAPGFNIPEQADIDLLFVRDASRSDDLGAVDQSSRSKWGRLKEVCFSSGAAIFEDKTALVRPCFSFVDKKHALEGVVLLLQADLAKAWLDLEDER